MAAMTTPTGDAALTARILANARLPARRVPLAMGLSQEVLDAADKERREFMQRYHQQQQQQQQQLLQQQQPQLPQGHPMVRKAEDNDEEDDEEDDDDDDDDLSDEDSEARIAEREATVSLSLLPVPSKRTLVPSALPARPSEERLRAMIRAEQGVRQAAKHRAILLEAVPVDPAAAAAMAAGGDDNDDDDKGYETFPKTRQPSLPTPPLSPSFFTQDAMAGVEMTYEPPVVMEDTLANYHERLGLTMPPEWAASTELQAQLIQALLTVMDHGIHLQLATPAPPPSQQGLPASGLHGYSIEPALLMRAKNQPPLREALMHLDQGLFPLVRERISGKSLAAINARIHAQNQ